jgi:DNA-binding FadR family transcriptional regulator
LSTGFGVVSAVEEVLVMGTIQRHPLAAQAAEVLLNRVRTGEWALGGKLPSETALAAELGVGRSTVREAIRGLAGQGVLEPRQGLGVFVTALDVAEDWDVALRRASIGSVLEARVAVETEAAVLAAGRRTLDDLRSMRRYLEARSDAIGGDLTAFVDADSALHRSIVVAAHNEVLVDLFDGFANRVHQTMMELLRNQPESDPVASQTAHAAIVAAVVDRDPVRAGALSRAHLTAVQAALP